MRHHTARRRLRRLPPDARRRAIDAGLDCLARQRTAVAVLDADGNRLADTGDWRAAELTRRGKATWVTHDPPVIQLTRRPR
jgi:hypothetical protein